MKSYVIFLFFLFVFSARLAGQHTLPVTILPSAQTGSPGVMSLNGTWKFMMLPSLQSAIPDGWIKSEFNDLDWNEIHVPGNWEPQGFKQPEYGHDLTACMGLYRTHFSIPSDWKSNVSYSVLTEFTWDMNVGLMGNLQEITVVVPIPVISI